MASKRAASDSSDDEALVPARKSARLGSSKDGRDSLAESDGESDADPEVAAGIRKAVDAASAAADSDAESDGPAEKKADDGADSDAESGGAKSGKKSDKGDDSDSDSDAGSSSSSSSKSSSSSSSEDEKEAMAAGEDSDDEWGKPAAKEEEREDPGIKKRKDLDSIRSAQVKRDELCQYFLKLPEEALETALKRSFVRLTMADACVIAEVVEVVDSPQYKVKLSSGREKIVKVQLKCRRGSSTKAFKLANISNGDITEADFEQWKELIRRSTGVDPDVYVGQLDKKAEELHSARNFNYSESVLAEMIRRKGNLEFEAQKESRMKSLMQCSLSQMHISAIRDNEPHELQKKYTVAQEKMSFLQARSTQLQDHWFLTREDTFSLKEINKKNLNRQNNADDRALVYTYEQEEAARVARAQGLIPPKNAFERRPCRPVVAWDTSLTEEGVDRVSEEDKQKEADKKAADKKADEVKPVSVSASSAARVKSVLSAHRRANLLSKVGLGIRCP